MSSNRPIYVFDNQVKVYREQLLDLQLNRYQEVNLHEPVEEAEFTKILQEYPASPFVFVDIGAAIGYYCILAKKIRPDIVIHAFEPLGLHRQYFHENLLLNQMDDSKITLYSDAISDNNGKATLRHESFGSGLVHQSKRSVLKKIKNRLRDLMKSKSSSEIVKTITLDSFAANLGTALHLVKVDVQGFETEVLKGASQILKQGSVKHWIIGTHSAALHESCCRLLLENQYQIIFDEQDLEHQPDGLLVAKYPEN
jgi:FkbM family methyltransferase